MAKPTPKSRVIFRIQLTTGAKERLHGISDQLGITQIAITSKLVEWFASQDEAVRAAILGLYPDAIQKEVATLVLGRMKK